ncbi:nuclear transport factor 2 family protein [Phytohabitans kaempferiae]|uniref:Nuclear transport factor 2 family protein n=1 Tax=Phytohabitans kaempferiae TaxID=1620943 RepID=A0ABV6LZN6_9ACTN
MTDEALDERVARLLDERDILATLNGYAHAMDYHDEATWVDAFTEDAVFDVVDSVSGVRVHREEGREELARYIANYPSPPPYRKHVMVNPVVTVDGRTATVRAYWILLERMAGKGLPELVAFGAYRDRLVKQDDGKWRIVERFGDVEANARVP